MKERLIALRRKRRTSDRNRGRDDLCYSIVDSPPGKLLLVADDDNLRVLNFQEGGDKVDPLPPWRQGNRLLDETERQLGEYFDGKRQEFQLPLQPIGTPFQLRAWKQLQQIPYGSTWTYGDQARRVGNPRASRAVGAANGRNPIAIIIPCHRVIGGNGRLVGFGGGLNSKRWLLEMEASVIGSRALVESV